MSSSIDEYIKTAWDSFCSYYDKSRKDFEFFDKTSDFHGPHFREESDIVFHFARLLYGILGDKYVHLESPIYGMYFDSLKGEKKRKVDIEISSPEIFMQKNASRQALIEVKWIWRGIKRARSTYFDDIMEGIMKDFERLKYLKDKECCQSAYMCIVDEEPNLTKINSQKKLEWEKKFAPVRILVKSYQSAPK